MIVEMKKITLLLRSRHREDSLKKLRQLGVLHIQHVKAPESEDIQSNEKRIDNLRTITSMYANLEEIESLTLTHHEIEGKIDEIMEFRQEKEALQRLLDEKKETHRWFDRWGNVSLTSVRALKDGGVDVRFYMASKHEFKKLQPNEFFHIANFQQNMYYFAYFSRTGEVLSDLREDPMPLVEITELNDEIRAIESKISSFDEKIMLNAKYSSAINQFYDELNKRLTFSRVKSGMGEDGDIIYLQGYCPEELTESVKKEAERQGWGYVAEKPDTLTEVPTLTHNPRWIRIINPLFNFMGTLPGYDEMDVSSIFLAFFSIFYAIIIGDAGYGLVFLIATFFVSRKHKGGSRDFINLMYLLSFTTIVWGMLSGTWFGSEEIAQLPILRMFIIDSIYSFNEESQGVMMQLSFIIGCIHLSLAHLLVAIRKMNSWTAIAEIGWIVIIWSVYFVANFLVLGKEIPEITIPLLSIGVIMVLIFANFQKNILKGMLSSLANLPLSVVGAFSDIVSYIRLFAVGLATVIVSSSFNSMAIGSGIDSVVSGIIAALILFIGHALNLTLGAMSVLVHGVRLNLLEFSGHVGVQWTGRPYTPFKE